MIGKLKKERCFSHDSMSSNFLLFRFFFQWVFIRNIFFNKWILPEIRLKFNSDIPASLRFTWFSLEFQLRWKKLLFDKNSKPWSNRNRPKNIGNLSNHIYPRQLNVSGVKIGLSQTEFKWGFRNQITQFVKKILLEKSGNRFTTL